MRAKQAKEREHKLEEKVKCVPEPFTVLLDDGDFPDIETMSSKVPPEGEDSMFSLCDLYVPPHHTHTHTHTYRAQAV